MKNKLLLLLCIIFIQAKELNAQAIQFNRVDSIPVIVNGVTLNNAWAGGINFPLFSEIDLDGDGILDLFMFDRVNNRTSTFINNGTPGTNAWHYDPQYISHFPPINKWALLYDYNCDGKVDFFTLSSCQCGVAVYRNDFDVTNGLQFTLVADPLLETFSSIHLGVYASAVSLPTFGDVDYDGDMDIIGYSSIPDGHFSYHRNYSVENGYGCDSLQFNLETQDWGMFQLLIGGANLVGCYQCRPAHEGDADATDLSYYDQSEAARKDDTISSVFMIDIDGDRDKELLIGDQNAANTLMVLNGKTPSGPDSMITSDPAFPSYDVTANIFYFTVHAYTDVDNDGQKDLIISSSERENLKNNWFYKNTLTTDSPAFDLQTTSFLTDQMIDVGEGACPVLFDADGDGLQDLVIGNYGVFNSSSGLYKRGLQLFKNIGTSTAPAFQLTDNNYAGINSLTSLFGSIYPTFGDLTGDGIKEMIIGSEDGKLQHFSNSSVPASFILDSSNYCRIDVGSASTPQLIDLNRDGLLDLVVGGKNGFIKYYQNSGTATVPNFDSIPTSTMLGGIDVRTTATPDGYAVPFVFEDQGQYKLLVSCMKGDVYLYDNIDGNVLGTYHLVDTVISLTQGERLGFNLAVSGGDLNNDGLTDMLLGIYSGGVNVYLQYNPNAVTELSPVIYPSMVISPNPANELCEIQFFNLHAGKNQLSIVNYLGQTLLTKNISSNNLSFNTKEFPSGMYMVQLISGGSFITRKLMVNH